jgi:hypothetical protein
MSQARVTDFFSTRKRSRQDEIQLNKEKRLKSVETQITTRSRAAKKIDEVVVEEKNVNQSKKTDEVPPAQQQQLLTDATNIKPVAVKQKQKVSAEELKAKMQKFSQKLQKHKEKYSEKNIEKEKEQQVEVQIENMNKIQDEINKICSKNSVSEDDVVPAYSKYANLASVEYEQKLVLPVKYQNLFDMFKGSDTVVKFMHNRQEICTFLKLKNSVQNITKK